MKLSVILIGAILTLFISCKNKEVSKIQEFKLESGFLYDSNGTIVNSTIDGNLQNFIDSILKFNLNLNKAESACAVIMDTKTGEIKALSNFFQRSDGSYSLDSNIILNHYFEFGSLFKLYSAMSLLDDGYSKPDDSVLVENGSCMIGGVQINDAYSNSSKKISFRDGFINSSNVVFAKLVYEKYKSSPRPFFFRLYETKLNTSLPLDIYHYNSPTIINSKSSDLIYNSIGYGIKMSPLHILTLYNSIANNGEMVYPYFAENTNDLIKKVRVCKSETAMLLKNFMESSLKKDSLFNSSVGDLDFAGFASTANSSSNKRVSHLSSYVGYFPASNPRYTCLVMFNSPQNGSFYGSTVSIPVFIQIANYLKK